MTPPTTVRTHRELWDAWSQLWNGDYALADDILSRTIRVNIPQHGMPDAETLCDGPRVASWIAAFRSSFDDDAGITGELGPFIVGDYAIGRWVFRGTWQGGRPATATVAPGTEVEFRGVDILRFEDGRIAEYWLSDDQLDLYAQLGAIGDTSTVPDAEPAPGQLRRRVAELPEEAGRRLLLEQVLDAAADAAESEELRGASGDESFLELGVNSLVAVALSQAVSELAGLSLPRTMVFDQPTPRALADHLWMRLTHTHDGSSPSARDALSSLEIAASELTDDSDPDGAIRAELVKRLNVLLGRLDPAPGSGTGAQGLESASPQELFAYLDSRLKPAENAG
ncbi:hypothetical protein EJ357_39435 [Streptomyces cyaneochromogenes]|uniref:Carrier domain-containing protein n=1 Tax=Streptomyces cyaneochromogenes TaxID=2496836 RepID=A0A3Q9EZ84_9ACTN|nr:ester cyclase [Streptomyces cyaneochromogenes]AZQ38773.1 hypothetical protein EJ357_39435 [Streptomyces cyaneochromogenes]